MTMNATTWTPAGAVTGLGSLPQTDAEAAVRYVSRACPQVPFWPQLPLRSYDERMIDQALAPLRPLVQPLEHAPWCYGLAAGVSLDQFLGALAEAEPDLPADAASGFYAFQHAAERGRFSQASALKGQLIGPVTLAQHLYRGKNRPFADHPQLIAALGRYLARLGHWQLNQLGQFDRPVVLFVDEPALGSRLTPAGEAGIGPALSALSTLLAELRQAGAVAGLHCCAPPADWSWLDEANPDLWAFDAYQDLVSFCSAEPARRFAGSGGRVAYGLVPTGESLGGMTAESLFSRWLQAASVAGDVTTLARQSLVTARCGLGRVDPSAASATFSFAHRVSYLISWIASGHHSMPKHSA